MQTATFDKVDFLTRTIDYLRGKFPVYWLVVFDQTILGDKFPVCWLVVYHRLDFTDQSFDGEFSRKPSPKKICTLHSPSFWPINNYEIEKKYEYILYLRQSFSALIVIR
jgi:hypothetical protein